VKIKLDENLPVDLARLLQMRGHDVTTIPQELLTGAGDDEVFAAARAEERMLFTLDLDFSDIRRFRPGTHPGLVLLRLRDPSRRRILDRIQQVLDLAPLESWAGCFVVITDRKLRVRS